MKNSLKQLSLALFALGLSTPSFANSNLLVPSQHGGLKVGIDALYVRSSNQDLSYAQFVGTNFTTDVVSNKTVDSSYDSGIYAQIGYLFPCTGNDLTLGYTYIDIDDTDTVVAPRPSINSGLAIANGVVQVMPLGVLAGDQSFGSALGKARFSLNSFDLDAGQRFTTGFCDVRLFAGLRYANMTNTLTTVADRFPVPEFNPGVNNTVSGEQTFNSQFRGVGPRIGVDGRYCLRGGFGVDANLSTALLAGWIDSDYSAQIDTYSFTQNNLTSQQFSVKSRSDHCVVPAVEAKLAVDYTHIMNRHCKSSIVVEAGYQATRYFNANEQASVLNPNDGSLLSDGGVSGVGFDGPYFGVKYYA
jgi:Legionella pneumophila major outer membrane protein precursor.